MRFTSAVAAVVLGAAIATAKELPKDEARGAGKLAHLRFSLNNSQQLIGLSRIVRFRDHDG
jgi:hypothetical protein